MPTANTKNISNSKQMCSLRSSCGWLQLFEKCWRMGNSWCHSLIHLMNSCCQYGSKQFIKRRSNEWHQDSQLVDHRRPTDYIGQTFVRIFYSILKVPTVILDRFSCARFVAAAHSSLRNDPSVLTMTKSPSLGLDFKVSAISWSERRSPSLLLLFKKVIQRFVRPIKIH